MNAILRRYGSLIALSVGALALVVFAEFLMGRSWFGPDGRFGWWDGDIWSRENSQRLADAYSFSHIGHGMVSYGLLFLLAGKMPLRWRFLIALGVECGWEILENSPVVIDRYRQVTISIGYVGDSILNSVGDVCFMSLGFMVAHRASVRTTVLLFLAMELGCLLWVRDNLILNVIMLLHPIESLRVWQAAPHVGG